MSKPNHNIFEIGSDCWHVITNSGEKEVPEEVLSIVLNDGEIIEERRHPVIVLESEEKWMINYSQVL